MSARLAPSAAPANAVRIWCDATKVYVELPTQSHVATRPHIMTFSRETRGLAQVLSLIYGHADNSSSLPKNFQRDAPLDPRAALAQSLLKQRGII